METSHFPFPDPVRVLCRVHEPSGNNVWFVFAVEFAFITIAPNNIVTLETETIQQNIKNPTNSTSLYIYYDADVGRLGNLLFGFSSAYGIAHQSKRQLICKSELKELNRLLPN